MSDKLRLMLDYIKTSWSARATKPKVLILLVMLLVTILASKQLSIWGIEAYQKYISPYKGYHCAYGLLHKDDYTCSQYGKVSIAKYGVVKGLALLFERFDECQEASREIISSDYNKQIFSGVVVCCIPQPHFNDKQQTAIVAVFSIICGLILLGVFVLFGAVIISAIKSGKKRDLEGVIFFAVILAGGLFLGLYVLPKICG